jgi:hypothetical protein
MKLTTYAWIMAIAIFVASMPQNVVAMFTKTQEIVFKTQSVIFDKAQYCQTPLTYMKDMARHIAKEKVLATYRSSYEWNALLTLWTRESRWDYTANNKHSSAYGIPQMLKMPEDTPMVEQINMGLRYIAHRYGSPSKALAFHNSNGWY